MHRSRFVLTSTFKTALLVAVMYHLAAPPRAAAYVDPLSGSIVLQVVVASILGVTVGFKRIWKSVATFVTRPFRRTVV